MNMEETGFSINTLAIFAAGLVAGILLLRFFAKGWVQYVGGFFLFGVMAIGLLVSGGVIDLNDVSISASDFKPMDFESQYCNSTENNEATCECIVKPLEAKLLEKYTPEHIEKMKSNRTLWYFTYAEMMRENKAEIKQCLKDRNASKVWDDFIDVVISEEKDNSIIERFRELRNSEVLQ